MIYIPTLPTILKFVPIFEQMKRINSLFLILTIVFLGSCVEEKPKYLMLGKNSFEKENYALARNQFSTIKSDDSDYEKAQEYLKKIDSIEKAILMENTRKDSIAKNESDRLREKYAGSYKIEVLGTSSKKQVEVYILSKEGNAEWLWVNYGQNKIRKSDDRKSGTWLADENSLTINIRGNSGMISETYLEKDGTLVNTQLSKRSLERTNETFQ